MALKPQCDTLASLNKIKRLLYERNISDAELARLIGGDTTRQDIHKVLNHRTVMPKLDWLMAIGRAIDVPLTELIVEIKEDK